ncbi:type 2 isopentenyl-diphosphate Delta-isomerase [Candidatus Bathyarchaeota archaeon]|nr:type 2 isopentenyl-diphosphate Delta-isomerase [Candidatus Bathyarchaeota archaeon]
MTERRKAEHLRICLTEDVQAKKVTTGFEDVHLVHKAVPEFALGDVDTSISFFNKELQAPIIIEAMTGGTPDALRINSNLAEAAEHFGLAMGVGSQRAALETPRLVDTFRVVREKGPSIFLVANLGLPQIVADSGVEAAERAVEMIKADALAIHMNSLQEAMQREGETEFHNSLERIREVASRLSVPVIVKETGAGMTMEDVRLISGTGAKGIDVGGAGGTSWAAVESYREEGLKHRLGVTFWDWGVPTAISVAEAASSTDLKVIASGGLRTGLDVCKAVCLGACAAGLAWPLLKPASGGQLDYALEMLIEELRTSMFLIGAKNVGDLGRRPVVITGKTAEWLRLRGLSPERYARRQQSHD